MGNYCKVSDHHYYHWKFQRMAAVKMGTLTEVEEHTNEPTYGSLSAEVVPEKSLNQTSEMVILDYFQATLSA